MAGDSPLQVDIESRNGSVLERSDTQTTRVPGLSKAKRYLILSILSFNTLLVTSTSTSMLIATPEISTEFHTTTQILNITNAALLIATGYSSLIWCPFGELTSRKISYNAAMVVMLIGSIGTATAPNLGAFTAMRLLSGFTGTYCMVAGQTIIADIFVPTQRGRAVGWLQVGSVSGTALGPCIGGVILTYSNWRSIYWLQVAEAGVGLILSLLFIPNIKSEVRQLFEKDVDAKMSVWVVVKRFSPIKVFKQLRHPQIVLADVTCGFLGVSQFGLMTCVRHIINPRFNLTTPLISGLFYIAPGAGFVVGAIVGGHFSDRTVKHWIKKRDGVRIPKDRLNSGIVHFFVILPASLLVFGWSLDRNFGGMALPIVMAFWIGVGLMGAWNGLNTYTGEVFPDQRAEVVSSKYVVQYTFGAAATAAIIPMIDGAGVGWSFSILAFLKLIGGALVLLIARYAPYGGTVVEPY